MASKENIYKAEKIPMPRKFDYVAGLGSVGDNIYILGTSSRTEGTGEDTRYISTTSLSIVAPDGSEVPAVKNEAKNEAVPTTKHTPATT